MGLFATSNIRADDLVFSSEHLRILKEFNQVVFFETEKKLEAITCTNERGGEEGIQVIKKMEMWTDINNNFWS